MVTNKQNTWSSSKVSMFEFGGLGGGSSMMWMFEFRGRRGSSSCRGKKVTDTLKLMLKFSRLWA